MLNFLKAYKSVLLVICITALAFSPTLFNGWTNWDDLYYTLENQYIQNLTFEKVRWIFSNQYNGNYAPLVLLSYALDHWIHGANAFGYHLTNFLLHLFNVFLVFHWLRQLTKDDAKALFITLMFGIHPMHLESVAWISSRKDLLFALFFLTSLLTWTNYAEGTSKKGMSYALTVAFFLLSILSKGVAVVLPGFLLTIDFVLGRKGTLRLIIEKIPFVVLSFVFGIIAIRAQQHTPALRPLVDIDFGTSMIYALHGYFIYLTKAIVPYNIGPFHPYPPSSVSNGYLIGSGFVALLVIAWLVRFTWIHKNRTLIAGVVMFTVGLLPVLQIIPVGNALVADRYTYIPYLGIFIIMVELIFIGIMRFNSGTKQSLRVLSLVYLAVIGFVSFINAKTWRDDVSLWSKVIEQHPHDARAFINRGKYYMSVGKLELAQADLTAAVEGGALLKELHQQQGLLFQHQKQWLNAQASFNKSLKLDGAYSPALLNLALNFYYLGELDSALGYFQELESMDPEYILLYLNRGVILESQGRLVEAEEDYSNAIRYHALDFRGYQYRGVVRFKQMDYSGALSDFNIWNKLLPKTPKVHRWLARTYLELDKVKRAKDHAEEAEQLGEPLDSLFTARLRSKQLER